MLSSAARAVLVLCCILGSGGCRRGEPPPAATPGGRLVSSLGALARATIHGESRTVLDGRTTRFALIVPSGAVLDVTAGVRDSAWQSDLGQLEFRITWQSGTDQQVLATRRVQKPESAGANRWQQISVPLGELAGQTGEIGLQVERLGGTASVDAAAVWTVPVVRAGPRPAGPNVILISIDTLRADHLGCYGYGRDTSPNIDSMAADGVLFESAIASSSWTLPSHASIFTGLHPSRHGAVEPGNNTTIPRDLDTLTELLWRAGYDTGGFVGGLFVAANLGFDQGFDIYRHLALDALARRSFRSDIKLAESWMDQRRDRRFFVFLHTYEVHMPYTPPAPYDTMFDPGYDGPYRTAFTTEDYHALHGTDGLGPRDLAHLQALYDGSIRNIDDAIGGLLGYLNRSSLRENTCVVFTSDHGDEFLEHGNLFHHQAKLTEELVRVPMIVWCPSQLAGGRRVAEPVSHVDVLPTVLDLAGVGNPGGGDGLSFYPALSGKPLDADRRTLSEVDGTSLVDAQSHKGEGQAAALRTSHYKLVTSTIAGQSALVLFDLVADPAERHDLAQSDPALAEKLHAELRSMLPERRRPDATESAPAPDAATREQMRALGYLE